MSDELVLDVHGLRLAALAWGPPDGPRALCLHGWLDNAASFARLAPLLPGVRLVALELPGHGHSQHRPPCAHYHFVDWVVDAAAAADALGWETFTLIGHSMGAAVASLFAGTLPERVLQLILIEALGPTATPVAEAPGRLAGAIAQRARPQRAPRAFPDLASAVERLRQVNPGLSAEGARLLVERGTRPIEGAGLVWRADARLRDLSPMRITEEHIRAFLSRIACPTLVVRARQGMPFDEEVLQGRFSCLGRAQLLELDGGHHLHLEDPGPLAAAIQRFLAGHAHQAAPAPALRPEAGVRLLALDVDGVLTDGGLLYDGQGGESKQFHVQDGQALRFLLDQGLEVALISGRTSAAVATRARELGIRHVHQGIKDKPAALAALLQELGLGLPQVAYMGDDLPDLRVMRQVGFSAAPADARPEVRQAARLVTQAAGGRGAVRELAEHLLRAQGRWSAVLAQA